jgi:uncharacterized protein (DUF58 family)
MCARVSHVPYTQAASDLIDPASLMRIKSLEMRAKVIVEGFWKGIHRSPYHGFSAEFTEYRSYSPGDDPRYIDWHLYARSDRLYIKRFEDETNLTCHLLVDQSRSMGYGSTSYTKSQYTATLAATLAYFLFSQGDAVGLVTFDEKIDQILPPRHRPIYLHQLMAALEQPPQGQATDLRLPIQQIARMMRRRGLVILVSDLLTPIEHLETDLGLVCAGGHDVVLFHVMDPEELNFTFNDPALFKDMESGQQVYVDPGTALASYAQQLKDHLAQVESICRGLGIDYHLFSTDRPFDLALLDFLQHRMWRRKQVHRKNRGGGQ